jgi:hypothetical protein
MHGVLIAGQAEDDVAVWEANPLDILIFTI